MNYETTRVYSHILLSLSFYLPPFPLSGVFKSYQWILLLIYPYGLPFHPPSLSLKDSRRDTFVRSLFYLRSHPLSGTAGGVERVRAEALQTLARAGRTARASERNEDKLRRLSTSFSRSLARFYNLCFSEAARQRSRAPKNSCAAPFHTSLLSWRCYSRNLRENVQ